HQTGGPTVFTLRDETGMVDCAAFEEAGVRAYPDVETDEFVAIEGAVERHREDLQIETADLSVLDDDDRDALETRIEAALVDEAHPESVELLAEDDAVAESAEAICDLAGSIR